MISKLNSFQKSWVWKIIPIAIAVPFVFQSITGGNQPQHNANYLVSFNDKTGIDFATYQSEYQKEYQQFLATYGPDAVTPEAEMKLRNLVLRKLVDMRLFEKYADQLGIVVSVDDVTAQIRQYQIFQENGKFSDEKIRQFLAAQRMTAEQFYALVTQDIKIQTVLEMLSAASVVVPREIDVTTQLALPSVEIQVAEVNAANYTSDITPTAEQLQNYYDKNRTHYEIPASAQLSYITYNQIDLVARAPKPTDAQAREYFENNKNLFAAETYETSIIEVADLNTANEVVSILSSGVSFADVAKKFSQDVGSASEGGYLGNISKEDLPEALGKTLAIMNEESYSQPIQDGGAYYILHLGKKAFKDYSFEQAREQIIADLTKLYQQDYLTQVRQKIDDEVEAGGNIDKVAEILGYPVQHTGEFTREEPPKFFTEDLTKQAFSGAFETGKVTSPQALNDNEVIILQMDKFADTSYHTFDEVKDKVTEEAKLQIAFERQTKRVNDVVERLNTGKMSDADTKALLQREGLTLSEVRTLPFYVAGGNNDDYYLTVFTSEFKGNKIDYITVPKQDKDLVYFFAVHGFKVDKVDESVASIFAKSYPESVFKDNYEALVKLLNVKYDVKINYELLGANDK